jgi:hypothetical protein
MVRLLPYVVRNKCGDYATAVNRMGDSAARIKWRDPDCSLLQRID